MIKNFLIICFSLIFWNGPLSGQEEINKNEVLINRYNIGGFDNHYSLIKNKENGLYGIYNNKEKIKVIPTAYDSIHKKIYTYSISFFLVSMNNKFGIIDENGKKIVPIKYDGIDENIIYTSNNTFFLVSKNGKVGIFNKNGKKTLRVKYKKLETFRPLSNLELFIAKKKKKWGLIDFENKKRSKFKYNEIKFIGSERFKARIKDKFGIISKHGKKITPVIYDDISLFFRNNGRLENDIIDTTITSWNSKDLNKIEVRVEIGDNYGYLDLDGNIVDKIDIKSDKIGYRNLKKLYEELVPIFQTRDSNKIREYCWKITPDDYSKKFLKKGGFTYRGFHKDLGHRNLMSQKIFEENYRRFLIYYNRFLAHENLDDLKLERIEFPEIRMHNQKLDIGYSETILILSTKTDSYYKFKIGELLRIDGVWKSFTYPKCSKWKK